MANQQLKDQFYSVLRDSRSFQLLNAEEQADLVKLYETVSDEQLIAAMEVLNKDEADRRAMEAKLKEHSDRQYKLAIEIKDLLRQIESDERKINNRQDATESNKAAEELLDKIAGVSDEPKKRKKVLGIF